MKFRILGSSPSNQWGELRGKCEHDPRTDRLMESGHHLMMVLYVHRRVCQNQCRRYASRQLRSSLAFVYAGSSAGWLLLLSPVRGVGAELACGLRLCHVMSYRKSSFWSDVKQNMAISTYKRQYYTVHTNEATVSPRRISKHGRNDPFCAHSTLKELD